METDLDKDLDIAQGNSEWKDQSRVMLGTEERNIAISVASLQPGMF